MTSIDKLKKTLKSRPKTYDWYDLKRVLESVGFSENTGGKTSGSLVKFTHPTIAPVVVHKPHPENQLKHYMVNQIADKLESEGLL